MEEEQSETAIVAAHKAFANPEGIIDHIEEESSGVPPHDLYRVRIEELMAAELDETRNNTFDQDILDDSKHIRETAAGRALEMAARHTGFVLGFEYCRDLLLSGAAKGGAK
jgi:hypothetical protein